MFTPVTFKGQQPGLKFLVLGAVHGNEKCGTAAINRIIDDIKAGRIKLALGQVTFIPITNPRAYEADTRFIERNLNRFLIPVEKPTRYEDELTNALCPLIAENDFLLDIHSYTIGGTAFASVEGGDAEENALAAALGAEALAYGWHEAYAASGGNAADPNESIGTTAYARMNGRKGVLIECGQHKDPNAIEVAYRAIRNALALLKLTDEKTSVPPKPKHVKIKHVFYQTDEGNFAKPWPNFAPVETDEVIAIRADGEIIKAPGEGCIVLPNANATVGGEWFYFGAEEKL